MCASVTRATSCGAPMCGCLITITSGSYAPSVSAVSLSDSPLSTDEPELLIDIVSAESRFAASSKLDDVRVDDSKKRLTTCRPRSVGSFFTSRSSERSKLRAVPSRRETSSCVRSSIEMRWRRGGSFGGSRSSRMTRMSAISDPPRARDQQDLVDLVDLDELHLDALVARRRQVLADVVGADRQLAVAAVGEHGELHARGPAVVEERLDGRADRPSGVEDVVDEDARHPLEREVERRRADDRLRMPRRLAGAHLDVVAVEGDVELAERELDLRRAPRSAGGAAARAARRGGGCRRARPSSRSSFRSMISCAMRESVRSIASRVENDLPGRHARLVKARAGSQALRACSVIELLSGLAGPVLKDCVAAL